MGWKNIFLLGCKFLLAINCVWGQAHESVHKIDISGIWRFEVDRLNEGVTEKWYSRTLIDEVTLPGSMITNNKGDAVNINTKWTASLFDSAFYKKEDYAIYRKMDNFKIPFFLHPTTYYSGISWYQRDIEIPSGWENKVIGLNLERCHWETRVWVDDKEVGMQNYLGTPHYFDLTSFLAPGQHRISIRVDNAIRNIDPGENSHSISDHTQGNWNGIVGSMFLEAKSSIYCSQIEIYPNLKEKKLNARLHIQNRNRGKSIVKLTGACEGLTRSESVTLTPGDNVHEWEMKLPEEISYWDEFHPNLYDFTIAIATKNEELDRKSLSFGCREWEIKDGMIFLNGSRAFLRGTLHCASFPITGYPLTDKAEWFRELSICKSYGINHIRFHSWCPPEAAFQVADELGLYLQIECSSWPNQSSSIGDGKPVDKFLLDEAENIVRLFGNHPSFCILAHGNEPAGKNLNKYLTDFVVYWKQKDNRRLYLSGAGWPNLKENDFLSDSEPRIQHWEEGLKSVINAKEPSTTFDWSDYTNRFTQPFVSHEIGQWCVYPNFKEIKKYTGVYKACNFEIFQETLAQNGMIELADSFLLASGKLQTLCYKADIEAALRTPKFGGFQLLGLNDFTGQGTALVGALDAFWDEKGYTSAAEYRRFNNSVVPLVRMERFIFGNNETFVAEIEIANFKKELRNTTIKWIVKNASNHIIKQGSFAADKIPIGNGQKIGKVKFGLSDLCFPSQLKLEVSINEYANDWDFWVFPELKENAVSKDILLTDEIDDATLDFLKKGGKVLLSLKKGTLNKELGGDIAIGFSSIFWNTSWTNGQQPHTLGILCNPCHEALRLFPTEYHSNYQWWDAMSHSGAIRMDLISKKIKPIVRVIDDWFTNRPLALLFEAKVGKGSLLVSGIDFHQNMTNRPAARQLLHSLQTYMNSESFRPKTEVDAECLKRLSESPMYN